MQREVLSYLPKCIGVNERAGIPSGLHNCPSMAHLFSSPHTALAVVSISMSGGCSQDLLPVASLTPSQLSSFCTWKIFLAWSLVNNCLERGHKNCLLDLGERWWLEVVEDMKKYELVSFSENSFLRKVTLQVQVGVGRKCVPLMDECILEEIAICLFQLGKWGRRASQVTYTGGGSSVLTQATSSPSCPCPSCILSTLLDMVLTPSPV